LTNVSATVADESITLAKLAHAAANTVLVRDANSTGDPSFKAVTNTQILIGDGTGFTAASLSGDVTMTNAGAVTIAANAVEGSMLNTNVAGTGLTVAGNNIDVDAAQTQITSVGTLTGLTVDGQITASGNISASGNGSFTGTLRADGNVDFNGDLDVDGTSNLDVVDVDGAADFASSITMASNQFLFFDEDQLCAWRAYNTPANGRIMMNRIGGVGGLMSMSGSNSKAYVGINTGVSGGHVNEGLTVNGMVSASLQFSTESHISASGNISASGLVIGETIRGNTIRVSDDGGTGVSAITKNGTETRFGFHSSQTIRIGKTLSTPITIPSNITASGVISCSGGFVGNGSGITNVSATVSGDTFATDLKIGRDSTDLIDFSTADNVIGFRVGNNDEMKLNTTNLQPATSNGLALGAANRQWSDLFLAEGAVINFDNGDVTLTQTGNNLTMAGGSLSASGDFGVSGTATITTNKFEKTSTTDADHQGDVVFFGGTTSMDNGKIYHYKSDGTWELADADAVANCDGLLAVALGTASDTNGMLLRGTVTLDHDPGAVGDVLYLSTTAGQATATAPSGNTDIARVVGYCLDASNGQIWFNPSSTFVEVSA